MSTLRLSLLSMAMLLGGCSLIPEYQRPASPSAAQYPTATQPATPNEDWRTLFNDPALQQLIESALVNNRDLRVAALNVEAFQAQYRIQRADLLPAVSANASESRQRMPSSVT
ncbi:multidrug transporter, partial [Pseudomonas sp. HMWF005]